MYDDIQFQIYHAGNVIWHMAATQHTVSIGQDAMDWSPPSCLSQWMRPLKTHMMVNGQRTLSSIRSELLHFYIALNKTIFKQSKATRVLRVALLSSDQYGAIGQVGFRRKCCRPRVETRCQGATSSSYALIARTASVELIREESDLPTESA